MAIPFDKKTTPSENVIQPIDSIRVGEQKPHSDLSDDDAERGAAAALAGYIPGTTAEKKLVRKIDLILLPALWWLYILAYLDRGNVANAKAAGLTKSLNLNDADYSLIVSIFFVGYSVFEVPSNLLLNKIRPALYLSVIMAIWGTCVAAISSVRSSKELLIGRFFLGFIEAGVFPGSLYLLTCWYKKEEVGKRFSIFYTSGCIAPALGGIMAGAILSHMDGVRGWEGWRWLFLIEGVVTVGFAVMFYFILVDYPQTTKKFFTAEECQLAYVRVLHDRQTNAAANSERLTPWQSLWAVLCDFKSYAFLVLYLLDSTATSISYFIPSTLTTMGYTSITAQWMTVPIWFSGAAIMVILSTSSDRYRERRWHITGCMTLGFICSIVLVTVSNVKAHYAMLCLYIGGIYTAIALILNWTSESMALPDQKRSVALAFVNSFGNLAIIWGSRLWISAESPKYTTGFTAVGAMTGASALIAASIPILFKFLPKEPATKAERDLIRRQAEHENAR
ncbi:major facilitator superfamily domain-containing protein [Hypoxylon rubiginosum]|uniref:Major facilitator superfamily domain-containing protein n=1 Tax=Hypoxylon rubiginosum TaxID=110542 RepID=A0ACC0CLL0_9PEZI|nr:major facilitator superfamily domain-containing protein [Hypoxylon rubiginosum]